MNRVIQCICDRVYQHSSAPKNLMDVTSTFVKANLWICFLHEDGTPDIGSTSVSCKIVLLNNLSKTLIQHFILGFHVCEDEEANGKT
jgi:hypothetical protein